MTVRALLRRSRLWPVGARPRAADPAGTIRALLHMVTPDQMIPRRPYRLSGKTMVVLSVGLSAALCGLCGIVMYQARQDAYLHAEDAAANVINAVEHDMQRNVELYDLSLRLLRNSVEAMLPAPFEQLGDRLRQQVVFDRAASAHYAGSMSVLDAEGNIVENSYLPGAARLNLADRDFFRVHRDRPDADLYISQPFRSRLRGGDWSVALSRRINNPDGSMAGVVVGALRLAYFRDLFGSMSIGPHDTITLLRTDGTVLARRPFDDGQVGRSLGASPVVRRMLAERNGRFEAASTIDGVDRSFVFAKLGGLPLVVDVGLSVGDVYAEWWRRTIAIGLITLLLCTAMAVLAELLRRELTRRVLAERDVRASEARYRLVAENASDIILHIGPSGEQRYISPSVRDVLGFAPEELRGWSWIGMVHPDDRERLQVKLAEVRSQAGQGTLDYRSLCKDGSERWLEAHIRPVGSGFGAADGLLINARDVSRRKQAEDKLAQIASTDALTGIANRRRFDEMLEHEWRRAQREEQPVSLLLLDADSFKAYNDHYGHPAGDDLLRAIATCIAGNIRRPGDFVARYGGEEFAVLLPQTEVPGAFIVAEQIRLAVFEQNLTHAGTRLGLATISIGGACVLPSRNSSLADLIRKADEALYTAKRQGRNRVCMAGHDVLHPRQTQGA